MAKGKHSTALFEVIAKGKIPPRAEGQASSHPGSTDASHSAGGSLATPKWWFKSRTRNEVKTMAPGQTVATPVSAPAPAVEPAPAPRVEAPPEPVAPPARRAVKAETPVDDSATPSAQEAMLGTPRVQPVSVHVDPERQQISLKLSYTSALIGGFGLIVVIGVAVLIGKSLSRGPAAAIAGPSTAQLRQGPANPGVLNVNGARKSDGNLATNTGARAATNSSSNGTHSTAGKTTPQPQPRNASEPSPPTTFFTDDPRRQTNLNYVIIQSYPDRDTADRAADFLTKHGIACTVERDLPAWRLPWAEGCSVVGVRGFTRITNNPDADAYVASINQASQKFAGNNRGFKAFQPQFYKWRKGN